MQVVVRMKPFREGSETGTTPEDACSFLGQRVIQAAMIA